MFAALVYGLAFTASAIDKDIVYRNIGGNQVMADFYTPELRNPKGDPFVLVVHGGAWTGGKRQEMAILCEALAKAGIASATIDYRLAPQSRWPAQIDDCQAAVRFFRANATKYGLNTAKVAAAGASAGGHLSLLLGFTDTRDTKDPDNIKESSRVQYVLNLFGPTDLAQDFDPNVAALVSFQVTGQKYDPASETIKSFSPVNFVDAKSAEVFTVHGLADTLVPPKQAQRLDEALKKHDVFHVTRMIPGMKHEYNPGIPEFMKAMEEGIKFLSERLQTTTGKVEIVTAG